MTANDLMIEDGFLTNSQPDLLQAEISSDLNQFVNAAIETAQRHPEIEADIEHDLDVHGLKKKALRQADQRYDDQLNPTFDALTSFLPPETCSCQLEEGRPRMPAIVVLVFILLRGWLGGPKSSYFQLVLKESISLHRFLSNLGLKTPGASTIVDNINAVSKKTLDSIHQFQLADAKHEGLDTFEEAIMDSTAVDANSKYPTDSNLIASLATRITGFFNRLTNLKLGFPKWAGRKLTKKAKEIAEEIERFAKLISMLSGKRNVESKRKQFYARIYTRTGRLLRTFRVIFTIATKVIEKTPLPPSKAQAVNRLVTQTRKDLENIEKISLYSRQRVFRDQSVEASEKIYSISDDAATIIKKGGRESVLGYKPQLAFSGNGLVTVHIVPEGNAADSGQLSAILKENEKNTGVVPKRVNADDGYTNRKERQAYLDKHKGRVEVFSFSGSKGRKAIGDETYDSEPYKETRAKRSAVESRIYTLKINHDYGEVMRRGQEAVASEQLEKALAYNMRRMIFLREAKARAEQEARLKKKAA